MFEERLIVECQKKRKKEYYMVEITKIALKSSPKSWENRGRGFSFMLLSVQTERNALTDTLLIPKMYL